MNGRPRHASRHRYRPGAREITSISQGWCVYAIGGLLAAVIACAASAAYPADASNGKRLALQWCASCHLVAGDQTGPTSEAPPFPTLAARIDLDAAKIALFLLDPHPRMPNMELTRKEAADLAAYIKSQQ